MKFVDAVVTALLVNEAHKATKYVSPTEVVCACRKIYGGRIDKRDKKPVIVLTHGRPNYLQRKFIKSAIKAGEPFPVKKVQLKFPPRR